MIATDGFVPAHSRRGRVVKAFGCYSDTHTHKYKPLRSNSLSCKREKETSFDKTSKIVETEYPTGARVRTSSSAIFFLLRLGINLERGGESGERCFVACASFFIRGERREKGKSRLLLLLFAFCFEKKWSPR